MKKAIKKEVKEEVVLSPVNPSIPEASEDEIELEELIAIRDGLTKRGISTDSRLGFLIDVLQRKLQK